MLMKYNIFGNKYFSGISVNNHVTLVPFLKPKKMHFLDLGSNLFLLFSRVYAKHRQPKMRKLSKSGTIYTTFHMDFYFE